ncbi:MAG: lipoyl(octanoyl) transferase LipB [Chloroflexi bacterium]|nr:lipoyl(octanoyl) transferase LipB [Chloroflexota bacterium]
MQPNRTAVPCTVYRYGLVEYQEAQELQRSFVARCRADGRARLLLLEHPPTYTFGARARPEHLLLDAAQLGEIGATVHETGRGGDITYHGPGQLVAYPILDLRRWRQGPRWYVRSLEEILIETLASFSIAARRWDGRPGVWIGAAKIAAIGVRISRGVTSHGFALNVDTDLSYFTHIVPCGLPDTTVTSMAEQIGRAPGLDAVMDATIEAFARVFPIAIQQPALAEATA